MNALFVRLAVSQWVNKLGRVVVSISPGFTSAEMVELVHEYHLQPHGQKGTWLFRHGLPGDAMNL